MTDPTRAKLLESLVGCYEELRVRLASYLGSSDQALDVLHDTYVALERAGTLGPVRSPKHYLLRIAVNIAWRRRGRTPRTVSLSEAKVAAGIADEAPDPARAAEARIEVAVLQRALGDLTARQRIILLDSRLRGIPLRKIAERLGISQRTVEIDLARALAHCALRLDREVVRRFGPRPSDDADE